MTLQCVCPVCDTVSEMSDLTPAQIEALPKMSPVCWHCQTSRMLQIWTAPGIAATADDYEPEGYA